MAHRIAIDIGGTFTDLVCTDDRGISRTIKVLSTPPALVNGVLDALAGSEVPLQDVVLFVHGTTQGLNALLERRGAHVALVTTAGFRDTYLIGRGHRPDMYNLHYRKPEPLLRRDAIFEVPERLDASGRIVLPLAEDEVAAVGKRIISGGFDAVAICFLHSYTNAVHERRAQQLLATQLPKCAIVTSSEVAPEWREYERTSTTVMSAYITPIMRNYLGELKRQLSLRGMGAPVYVTESNGGVMSADLAGSRAIATLLSGPVGGVIGARTLANLLGEKDLISVDVGGTSFDVSLIRDGDASVRPEFDIQGLPVLATATEIHTVGAGGGSIISVDPNGRLRVGPESAGAEPGPVSYGHGGMVPTITDAHVVLGHIPADQRLGETLDLDVDAATEAMGRMGSQIALSPTALAVQALEVVNFRMAEAIRELTVERGLDPASFTLCAFGGAGGLHAAALANELGIKRVLLPALQGSFSAWGMLQAGIRHDVIRSFFRTAASAEDVRQALTALEARAAALLASEGVREAHMRLQPSADLRYSGQEYALTIGIPPSWTIDSLAEIFHERYRERYGHASPGEQIEFVALRVAASAAFEPTVVPTADAPPSGEPIGTCSAHFDGRAVRTAVWRRSDIGEPLEGPALVLEQTATTLVPPGWEVRRTAQAHLLLTPLGGRR